MAPVNCPACHNDLVPGWLAMWNPVLGQKVRWQPAKPGWVRLKVPEGAAVVMEARNGGKDAREALRCPSCSTTVIPPDPAYGEQSTGTEKPR
jgi:hypothetical protein